MHSWGHKNCRYVGDLSLKSVKNFIGGQKEERTDSINVNYGRDFEHEITADIALSKNEFLTEDGSQKLIQKKGVEVGNIFQLGKHYSSKMNAKFTDKDGKEKFFHMGCYGIGIGRSMATIAEKHHDENGMIWPEAVAPFKVHLLSLNKNEEAEKLYDELQEVGVEVLYDDREEARAGEKFADADLIGCPYRIVMSEKTLKENSVELKKRDGEDFELVKLDEIVERLKK